MLLAELIREQVLRRTRDELPHAVEVQVSEVAHREDGVVEVHAHVWAEAESQKGILIGAGGRKIKEIGTAARAELERELGGRVFLDLQVRVRKRWRRDEGLLGPPRDRVGRPVLSKSLFSPSVHRSAVHSGEDPRHTTRGSDGTTDRDREEWTDEEERHAGG